MRSCRPNCGHRALVQSYREERQRQQLEAELAAHGYVTELLEQLEAAPLPTFRDWLKWTRRPAA